MTCRPLVPALVCAGLIYLGAGVAKGDNMTAQKALLFPERLHASLMAQPESRFEFVVALVAGTEMQISPRPGDVPLALINGFSRQMTVAEAADLADTPGVSWVWYLHPDEAQITLNTLQALDYAHATMEPPRLVNLSLGPPSSFYRETPDAGHPITKAIEVGAQSGMVAVMAIGNTGQDAPGFINPWTARDEVISVGAWDHTTGRAWVHSSRPAPGAVALWPDVVAPGVDVIGPMTSARPKTAAERTRDEANPRFQSQIPQADWDKYTIKSGTSQAAAVVSGAAAQIVRFLLGAMQEHGAKAGQDLFEITVDPDRITAFDDAVPRLTGRASPHDDGRVTYTYQVDLPWKMVKQILIDTALPVPGTEPWEVGAGLVDPDYIRAQFGAYGTEAPQLLPIKVK